MESYDVIIVGGGIGGLVTGALLADEGLQILLLEQGKNLGGCAATFTRKGYRFDTGATIACGFHENGPMHWLGDRLGIDWPLQFLTVAWEYKDGLISLQLDSERESVIRAFPASESFWSEQATFSDMLWRINSELLNLYGQSIPPKIARLFSSLVPIIAKPKAVQLARMTASQWLQRYGLDNDRVFYRFIDAQLLISAQATADESNALFAALALDLPRKSPSTLSEGMGTVANLLADSITQRGGRVHLDEKVQRLIHADDRIQDVVTTRNHYQGKQVVFNGSSASLAPLLDKQASSIWLNDNRARWSAFILHLGVQKDVMAGRSSRHLQIVQAKETALTETGSLFISSSHPDDLTRARAGHQALTVSCHTDVNPWWQAHQESRQAYLNMKRQYTEKILSIMEQHLGNFRDDIDLCLSGTPITYSRYTGRYMGLVGGYSQTRLFAPRQQLYGLKNCHLVGDHTFPGQSLPGVTVGATLVADKILRLC